MVGGSPSYTMRAPGRPSSSARSEKPGASHAITSLRASTRARPSVATCSVHGTSASRDEKPPATRRRDALRCATATAYSVESCARAGARRPNARSKYARRTAGPPLTTASRSGVKTSVATSERSCSAARSGAPFSFARLPSPTSTVTSSCTSLSPRRPRNAIRPDLSPKRTSCASVRVRGEKPCVPTCSDSSRFVLPAPFDPTTSTSPGSRSRSSRAYDRMFLSETVETISRAAVSA